MAKFNTGKLTVFVRHSDEHFNRVCQATIPEYWEAEVDMTERILDYFDANNDFTHLRIYGTSQDSARDAIQDCIDELKHAGLTGTVRVVQF